MQTVAGETPDELARKRLLEMATIDALIRVDLRETDPRILSKYMGRDEAQAFIEYHSEISRKAG